MPRTAQVLSMDDAALSRMGRASPRPMTQSMPTFPSSASSSSTSPLPPVPIGSAKPASPQQRLLTPESLPSPHVMRTSTVQLRAATAAAAAARAAIASRSGDESRNGRMPRLSAAIDENSEFDEGESFGPVATLNSEWRSSSKLMTRTPSMQSNLSLPSASGQRLHSPSGQRKTRQVSPNTPSSNLRRLSSKGSSFRNLMKSTSSMERISSWMRNTKSINLSRGSLQSMSSMVSHASEIPKIPVQTEKERYAVARLRAPSKHLNIGLPAVTKAFPNLGAFVSHHRTGRRDQASTFENDSEAPDTVLALPPADPPTPLPEIEEASEPDCWDTEEAATELHEAAMWNDAEKVRRLLHALDHKKRVPPDLQNTAGETAALRAARGGRLATCVTLLDGRADPLARDTDTRFFNDGIWPDESNPDHVGQDNHGMPPSRCGRTVVYHLRLQGLLEEVLSRIFPMTRLAMMRAVSEALEAFHLKPALVVAANNNFVQLMGLLLTHTVVHSDNPDCMAVGSSALTPRSTGTSCFSRTTSQMTWSLPPPDERAQALHVALARQHWQCAKVLLTSGVPRFDLNSRRDRMGRTALHLAAIVAEPDIVRMLLEAMSSPAVFSQTGRQPLHEACVTGKLEVAAALLDFKADLHLPVKDMGARGHSMFKNQDSGKTPMQLAEEHQRHKVLVLLRERASARQAR